MSHIESRDNPSAPALRHSQPGNALDHRFYLLMALRQQYTRCTHLGNFFFCFQYNHFIHPQI